jgi:hypothetical protein
VSIARLRRCPHPRHAGFLKFVVSNVKDLELLLMHNRKYCAEIAHNVSTLKRKAIVERAAEVRHASLPARGLRSCGHGRAGIVLCSDFTEVLPSASHRLGCHTGSRQQPSCPAASVCFRSPCGLGRVWAVRRAQRSLASQLGAISAAHASSQWALTGSQAVTPLTWTGCCPAAPIHP